MSNIIQISTRRSSTYTAKPFLVSLCGDEINSVIISGTLDGFLDFVVPANTESGETTNIITLDEAREIAAKLLLAVEDVRKNCLYDKDTLLSSGDAS